MALVNCSECNKEVSDKASSCPNCGNPINQPVKSVKSAQISEEEHLCCPKCLSEVLHAEKTGLLAGTIGSKDIQMTCLKCGNKFKAGEAKVIRPVKNYGEDRDNVFDSQLTSIIQNEGKIKAVKFVMDKEKISLSAAKQQVDEFMQDNRVTPSSGKGGCASVILIFIIAAGALMYIL